MLWQHPSPHLTRLDAFRKHVNRKYELQLTDYDELHRWSVKELELFSRELWDFCGVVHSIPPHKVATGLETMWPRPKWFPGARLNYTENILTTGLSAHPNAIAVSACREGGTQWQHISWRNLRAQVERWAAALKNAGIIKGDRVAAVTTNSVESVLLLLATASIGAIFSSTSPDMGVQGIVERYAQIQPKIIFVDSEVLYNGKVLDLSAKLNIALEAIREKVDCIQTAVVISGKTWDDPRATPLTTFLDVRFAPLHFEQVPFDHPVYILYSSGTTGSPKCICHAGGAALLQQKKEFVLTSDMNLESVYYQYTTVSSILGLVFLLTFWLLTGWMMWNYLIGSLSLGSRIVLYDGSPLYPSPMTQLQILEEQGVTHWGTSPNFLASLKRNFTEKKLLNLEALHLIRCAGSPLSSEICDWLYTVLPSRIGLFNASGGTDLVSGIIDCNVLQPVQVGDISRPQLGMKVEIWNSTGQRIDDSGEKGNLMITKPFFSMPTTFWGDGGMEKYEKAYFSHFQGSWWHGDFVRKKKNGSYEILGRSDGVLNPGGIRFGTAEIYSILDRFPTIEDYIAVGQRRSQDIDEQVLLFLKLKSGTLDNTLIRTVKQAIRKDLSARHIPAYIEQVSDIPYTLNGKRVENVVKDIVSGRSASTGQAIRNPDCLDFYKKFASLPSARSGSSKL